MRERVVIVAEVDEDEIGGLAFQVNAGRIDRRVKPVPEFGGVDINIASHKPETADRDIPVFGPQRRGDQGGVAPVGVVGAAGFPLVGSAILNARAGVDGVAEEEHAKSIFRRGGGEGPALRRNFDTEECHRSGGRFAAFRQPEMVAAGPKVGKPGALMGGARADGGDRSLPVDRHVKKILPRGFAEDHGEVVAFPVDGDAAGLPDHDRRGGIGEIDPALVVKSHIRRRDRLSRRDQQGKLGLSGQSGSCREAEQGQSQTRASGDHVSAEHVWRRRNGELELAIFASVLTGRGGVMIQEVDYTFSPQMR